MDRPQGVHLSVAGVTGNRSPWMKKPGTHQQVLKSALKSPGTWNNTWSNTWSKRVGFAIGLMLLAGGCSRSEEYGQAGMASGDDAGRRVLAAQPAGEDGTQTSDDSRDEIIVPARCLPPGKAPDKPNSFQIINKSVPECAVVERALRKRERLQWDKEIEVKKAAKREQISKEYRRIEVLEPPVITRPSPKVAVKDLGMRKAPKLQGELLEAFSGADERYYYLVTTSSIYVMGRGGKVVRRIAKQGDEIPGGSSGVRWSSDARWFWRTYVLKEDLPEDDEAQLEYYARTDVYDKTGSLWWSLKGMVISISPDGRKAAVDSTEGKGMGFIEKGEDGLEAMVDIGGASKACVFDDGMLVVGGWPFANIVTLDQEGRMSVKDKLMASCTLQACFESLGRAFVKCSDDSTGKAQLLALDSRGEVKSRSWFPSFGHHHISVDWKKKHLLIGLDTGEALCLDIQTGEALHRLGRLDGLEQPVPIDEFEGTREEFHKYLSPIQRKIRKQPLVYEALLLDGAVLRLRRPYDSDEKEGQKQPLLEIVDLAGKVLYSRNLELDQPNALPHGYLPLPVVWKEGDVARILSRDELRTIRAVQVVD